MEKTIYNYFKQSLSKKAFFKFQGGISLVKQKAHRIWKQDSSQGVLKAIDKALEYYKLN